MRQLSGIKVFLFGFLCSSFGNNRVGIEKPNTESLSSISWEAFVENRE